MAAATSIPPPLQPPNEKDKKYDRQLRLWAASGQRALEKSHILLVIPKATSKGSSSSVAGIETLKNLVLPGIGAFTIADTARVTEADLGINFFLEAESLGKSRAEECTRLLKELNPDVKGTAVTDDYEESIRNLVASIKKGLWSLIILCEPISLKLRGQISRYAQFSDVPVVSISSQGFFSTFSVHLPSAFPVVDTHPDPQTVSDLRIFHPWPELSAALTEFGDINALSSEDHGHVPYLLLLLYYLEEWKASHKHLPPSTFKEKTQFRDLIRSGIRGTEDDENYGEAIAAVLKTLVPPSIGSGCRDMFSMPQCTGEITESPSHFWLIAIAVKQFYEKHRVLPLPGSLPDMKAKSADYIKLQNIYKTKARADVAEVAEMLRGVLGAGTTVPIAEVEAFCKNASHVKIVPGTALPQLRLIAEGGEGGYKGKVTSDFKYDCLFNCPSAYRPFPNKHETSLDGMKMAGAGVPKTFDPESLVPIWWAFQKANQPVTLPLSGLDKIPFVADMPAEQKEAIDTAVQEIKRAGGGELHNISSLTGGMVAQEIIKIITKQYVPIDNTCIYDGIRSRVEVHRL